MIGTAARDSIRPDESVLASLQRAGLIDDPLASSFEALAGGVSSDIWRVRSPRRDFCVKRALPSLKVAADWQVPIERNAFEVAYNEVAAGIVPGAVPDVFFHDASAGIFAMPFFDPAEYRLWKQDLLDGRADAAVATAVAQTLVRIHSATAFDDAISARFPRHDIFHAIRLEPYLEATALVHPDLADELLALSRTTGSLHIALIHGDVSPKNILVGDHGPVLLDAECACIGDPAFDLAFCLNHLLLKGLVNPAVRPLYSACYSALSEQYLAGVDWEAAADLERRAARLLPALLLARVDGKSPVEYLTNATQRAQVRHCARLLINASPRYLGDVLAAWNGSFGS